MDASGKRSATGNSVPSRKRLNASVRLEFPSGQVLDVRSIDVGKSSIAVVAGSNLRGESRCTLSFPLRFKDGSTQSIHTSASVATILYSEARGGFVTHLRLTYLPQAAAEALERFIAE